MFLLYFLLFGLTAAGSFAQDSDNPENHREVLSYQLHSYVNDYERHQNTHAAWLIYLVHDSQPESHLLLKDIVNKEEDNFPRFSKILSCTDHPETTEKFTSFAARYVYCLDNVDVTLAYLQDHDLTPSFNSRLDRYANENSLSSKQQYHLELVKNDTTASDYQKAMSEENFRILDFYFFDHAFTGESNSELKNLVDPWVAELSSVNALQNTYHTALFLATANALYKLDEEIALYELSQKIINFSDLPVSEEALRMYDYISYVSYISGYYQYDIDFYRNIILPLSGFFSIETQMQARLDYGVSLFRIGNTTESLKELELVYESFEGFTDFRYQAALLNNLGIAYLNNGYFDRYIQLQLEALEFAEQNNDLDYQIQFINNLYAYHRKIRNWSAAYEYLVKLQNISEKLNDKEKLARTELGSGTYHRDFHDNKELAFKHFDRAYELTQEIDNYSLFNRTLAEFANTYEKHGEYDKALDYQYQRVEMGRKRNNRLLILYSYMQIANLHFLQGRPDQAQPYIDTLKTVNRDRMRFRYQVNRETVISKSLIHNNKADEALPILREYAEELVSRMRHSADLQTGHLYMDDEYVLLFKLLVDQLVDRGHIEEAFYWMDEVKNLSAASFYHNPALKARILSESELIMDFALRNRIERLRNEIWQADENQTIQLNNQLLESISELNVLRRKVFQNIDLNPVEIGRLRRKLKRSDIILYFSVFDDQLFAATITSGSYDIQQIAFSRDELARIDTLVESQSTDRIQLSELQWVKEKILDEMNISERYTNYYVIPDGFLYQIPLEILPVNGVTGDFSYGDASYLIEHASISYANSLKELEQSFDHSTEKTNNLDFLGFGISDFSAPESQLLPGKMLPPLPLAEKEVSVIASNMTRLSNKNFHLSEESTEQQFRSSAGNSRLLHVASHSEVFENDPLYSLIYLNSENDTDNLSDDDGLVYAYELFEMDLSNEMVMINSCESGSGNYIQGSGIVGFSRAFNYAGVQSLILNLWSIRDLSAYQLSVSFYSYLNEGMGKDEAMRKAKIDYINTRNSNPAYWGSFVVYGNSDPVVKTHNGWLIALTLLFIGFISLVIPRTRIADIVSKRS